MKLLYLDSMDVSNLGDGKWGAAAVDVLANLLTQNNGQLALSEFHFVEAIGIGRERAERRFIRFIEAGIKPLVFACDPRDVELRYVHQCTLDWTTANLTTTFFELTPKTLAQYMDTAVAQYNEMRGLNIGMALSKFFAMQADPRSHAGKVSATLRAIENGLARPDFEEQIARVRNIDLNTLIPGEIAKRFEKKLRRPINSVIQEIRPQIAEAPMYNPRDCLVALRTMLQNHDIDIDGADANITWGEFGELMMIRSRALEVCAWRIPTSILPFLVANRIPFELDAIRRTNAARIPEPGDELDEAHAMHLPFVSLMTADVRTVSWLRCSRNPRIRRCSERLMPGGDLDKFRDVLAAFTEASQIGELATSTAVPDPHLR